MASTATWSKHRCSESCLYARGPICTCSCGGARHGRGLADDYEAPDAANMFSDEDAAEHTRRHAPQHATPTTGRSWGASRPSADGFQADLWGLLARGE